MGVSGYSLKPILRPELHSDTVSASGIELGHFGVRLSKKPAGELPVRKSRNPGALNPKPQTANPPLHRKPQNLKPQLLKPRP